MHGAGDSTEYENQHSTSDVFKGVKLYKVVYYNVVLSAYNNTVGLGEFSLVFFLKLSYRYSYSYSHYSYNLAA